MKIVNLTPHAVRLLAADGSLIAEFPSVGVARAASTRKPAEMLDICGAEIPVNITTFGDVENLPPQEDGVRYIVSAITARAAGYRSDLLLTDDTVRDADGKIVGCRAFALPG